ncbi:MAG: hypothetical protein ACXWYM_00190 [Candidatus Binatia bacterium]
MLKEDSIRASSISSYNDCARRGAAKMFPLALASAGFALNKSRRLIGSVIGTGAHAAMNHMLQSKIDTGESGKVGDAEEIAIDSLRKDVSEGVEWDKSVAPNMPSAEGLVRRHTRAIHHFIAPKIKPVALEESFEAEYRGMKITGHVDVREPDTIGDLKTGKFERPNFPQYGTYVMLGRTEGHTITKVREFYDKTVALDKPSEPPKILEISADIAAAQAKEILDFIIDDYNKFLIDGNPAHFRANPSSILCGPKYCTAYGTEFCKYHKGAS